MGSSSRSCPSVLRVVAAVAVLVVAHAQYVTNVGQCPNYQTKTFTKHYLDKLIGLEDGLILAMTTGGADACQVLNLHSNDSYTYSFVDVANFPRNYTDSYTATTANLTHAAEITLDIRPGLLGAGLSSVHVLNPVLALDDLLVLTSCRTLGILSLELVMVFVPKANSASYSYPDTMQALNRSLVPHIDRLVNVSQSCAPGVRLANAPLPLRIYNLLTRLTPTMMRDRSSNTVSARHSGARPMTYSVDEPPTDESVYPTTSTAQNVFVPFFSNGAYFYQSVPVEFGATPAFTGFPNFQTTFYSGQTPTFSSGVNSQSGSSDPGKQYYIQAEVGDQQYTRYYQKA